MSEKETGQGKIDETYTLDIEPLINKLRLACKAHNMPLLVAVDVPLTQNAGVSMLTLLPNKDGQVSTPMFEAYKALGGDSNQPG